MISEATAATAARSVSMGSGRAYLSGARLSGVHLTLPWPRESLNQSLRVWGSLEAQPVEDYPSSEHPICFELWRITGGRLELGGTDQHEYCATLAAAYGSILERSVRSLVALRVSRRLGARARELSQMASLYLGTYHELLVSIPNVRLAGRVAEPHTLVLGMITDSRLARWGDTAFGFRYNKQPGIFETDGLSSWRVSAGGCQLMSVRVTPASVASPPDLGPRNYHWQSPLLGGLGTRRWVGSQLQRDLLAPDVRVSAAAGTFDLSHALALGPGAGVHDLAAESSAWAPLLFANVDARVSYPWSIEP